MRRTFVNLLLAHVIASYGVVAGITLRYGPQGAAVLIVAPVWAPYVVWESTSKPYNFGPPLGTIAAAEGSYAACFVATLAWRHHQHRRTVRSRRRRSGLCGQCGYDLRGNVSGACPECGTHVRPKAQLMLRRGR